MKLNRVLVICKKPPTAGGRALSCKKTHLKTIHGVEKILKEFHIASKIILRDKLKGAFKADLIITIGGDGTLLSASHFAKNTPILGVNSSPATSVGFFCGATSATFKKKLPDVIHGGTKPTTLPMLEASIDGKRLPYLAVNDILFAGASPAETVQYTIYARGKMERQRGSGVWIAAGPGSSAGIRSAGGRKTKITSRLIQFKSRELCKIPNIGNYKLCGGFAPEGGSIRIVSEASRARAFIDGTKSAYPVRRGGTLKVKIAKRRLKIFL